MKQILGLQYLRFASAMLVVAMHATEAVEKRIGGQSMTTWQAGSAGVDIFFVISGVVMAMTTREGAPDLKARYQVAGKFIRRRLIRIVPMYWIYSLLKVAMVLAFPALAMRTVLDSSHVLGSFLFLPMMAPWGLVQPVLPVGWSLNFEMFFYLIFAAAILSGLGRVLFCVLAFAMVFALKWALPESDAIQFLGRTIIFEFLFGVLIGQLIVRGLTIPKWAGALFLVVGMTGLIGGVWPEGADRALTWGVSAALVVLGVLGLEFVFQIRSSMFERGAFWGDASYSIYLSHTFVVPAVVVVAVKANLADPVLIVCVCFVVSALVGAASYLAIERPITEYLRKRFG
jgi:exopolysaccharide production protein ExoZ